MEQQYLAWIAEQQERLSRICRFYARDAAERQDLYQDILYQIWKAMPRFRGDSSPGTWIYRIAVNTALMHRRTQGRRKETALETPPELAHDASIESNLDREAQLSALYRAIDQLKDLDRTLILLFLEELSYEEMAEVTGLTVNHVGVRLSRAKKRLSNLLTPTHSS